MSRWFRVDDGLVDDPKVQQLPDRLIVAMLNLWCITSQCGGNLPPVSDIAFKLRITAAKATKLLDDLRDAKLIDDDEEGSRPHNWNTRQFKSDVTDPTNAERQRRYRNRDKTVTETVTVTPTRAETEADTETEGTVTAEIPKTTISENLADASGGRKPTRPLIDGFFDQFWKVYPQRGEAANPKKPARDKFERAIRAGAEPTHIIAAAQRYSAIESTAGRSNTEKIAQAVTWLNQQRWNDYPQAAPAGAPTPPDPSMPSDAELRARHAKRIPDDPKPEDAGLFREGNGAHPADEEAFHH